MCDIDELLKTDFFAPYHDRESLFHLYPFRSDPSKNVTAASYRAFDFFCPFFFCLNFDPKVFYATIFKQFDVRFFFLNGI